jgi:hypothetical protein
MGWCIKFQTNPPTVKTRVRSPAARRPPPASAHEASFLFDLCTVWLSRHKLPDDDDDDDDDDDADDDDDDDDDDNEKQHDSVHTFEIRRMDTGSFDNVSAEDVASIFRKQQKGGFKKWFLIYEREDRKRDYD